MMENVPLLFIAGVLLCLFFCIGYGSKRAGAPAVLMFIVFGVIAAFFIAENEYVHLAAEVGIVLLFFVLGLEFPLARIVTIAKTVWPAGIMDVVFNFGGPFLISRLFKLDLFSAIVVGGVAYATSSSITAKLLEEKKRLANIETEFILALLIFEDLVSPVLISFLAGIRGGELITGGLMAAILVKVLLLVLGAAIIGYYGFRKLAGFVSAHLEADFMPLLTVGIALLYAGLAVYLGLSEILGAFLAGVMLSETGGARELDHLLLPIRDVTLPFFFFWFGTTITFGAGMPFWPLLIILIIWSIAGKIAVGVWGGRLFCLSPRTAYRAGFSLVQRGEFSAIIAGLAVPGLRMFSGIYILASAFIGIYFFEKAPVWSKKIQEKYYAKTGKL